MDAVTLGQPVTFTRTLSRRFLPSAPRSRRAWVAEDWPGQPEPEPRAGIVVGIRTLSDGEVETWGWDEPATYLPTRTFRAYLVAHHLRRKPVLVLPEHIKVVES